MSSYLISLKKQFSYYKAIADGALHQLEEQEIFWQCNEESNSIAAIMKHIAGNMLSRFTRFLETDGEKPWRNRDGEFDTRDSNAAIIFSNWEKGWTSLMEAIDALCDGDLEKLVYIRNEGHTVTEALNRQLAHYAYHVGQMVYVARSIRGKSWQSLSIPRNQSEEYNREKFSHDKQKKHFTDE